jgi:DNA polymerase (family 10)
LGVRIAINTDAHRPGEFDNRRYGVATAQRGWATAADVVNTWPLVDFLHFIAAKNAPSSLSGSERAQ